MKHEDIEVFKGKTFADLLKDIYDNSKNRKDQLYKLIGELSNLIKTSRDAQIIVPIIKEYMDIDVKSDEHLVKIAAVVQRLASSTVAGKALEGILTNEEKEQLQQIAQEETDGLESEIKEIEEKTKLAVSSRVYD